MKVGTDGVLLGAWGQVGPAKRILDIGTGCGLVALMAAQRNEKAFVTAIEVDRFATQQATENVQQSPFKERVEVLCQDLLCWKTQESYDAILCNPPFFSEDTFSPDMKRRCARSSMSLPPQQLVSTVVRLLSPGGFFSLVIPTLEQRNIITHCLEEGLSLSRRMYVRTVQHKEPKRVLLTFTSAKISCVSEEELVLSLPDGSRSEDYSKLTSDFYL